MQAAAGDLSSMSQQESLPKHTPQAQPSQAQPAGTASADQVPSTAGDALLAAQLQSEDQVNTPASWHLHVYQSLPKGT